MTVRVAPSKLDLVMRSAISELELEAVETDALAEAPFAGYELDPVGFGRRVLNETYTADVVKIMESVRDNPVTLAKSANATGKTHGAARIAVWFYKTFPGAQVYTTAAPPLANLGRLLWGELGSLMRAHPSVFAGDVTRYLNIQRDSRSFITGVAIPATGTAQEREARFSGKHAPHMLFICDEGDAIPDDVYRGIESCLSGSHSRLLVMFNPRMMAGSVYRMERDRQAHVVELSALRHPNVITGLRLVDGAVDREKTVQRINQWSRPLAEGEEPDQECFDVPRYLVGAQAKAKNGDTYAPLPAGKRKITNPALAYMTLGVYPGQAENSLIGRADIDAARARWDLYTALHGAEPPAGIAPVMGFDIAEFGQDQCVECWRYGGYVAPLVKWGKIDPDASATRGAGDYKEHGARLALVDGTGVGAGVAPAMVRQDAFAISVKVASSPSMKVEEGEFNLLRDQLWWSLSIWLRDDPTAMLPPDEDLLEELAIPTYSIKRGKIVVMDKDTMKELLKRSPDSADSLCLTFAPDSAQVWV